MNPKPEAPEEFCPAIAPGHTNAKNHGCLRLQGHSGQHYNGKNVYWSEPSASLPSQSEEKCGAFAASFIPRRGEYFSCVLNKGHEGNHLAGGTCVKHGPYVMQQPGQTPQCPKWPDCVSQTMNVPALQPPVSEAVFAPREDSARELCIVCDKPADGICENCEANLCHEHDSAEFDDVLACADKKGCEIRCVQKLKQQHSCPDWDGLIIDNTWPEFSVCTCFTKVPAPSPAARGVEDLLYPSGSTFFPGADVQINDRIREAYSRGREQWVSCSERLPDMDYVRWNNYKPKEAQHGSK